MNLFKNMFIQKNELHLLIHIYEIYIVFYFTFTIFYFVPLRNGK